MGGAVAKEKQPRRRRAFRRVFLGFALLVALLVLLLGGLQTPWAKGRMALQLAQQVETATGWQVAVGSLTGVLPWGMQLDYLELADSSGVWLRAEGMEVDMSGSQLLKGIIFINSVTVESVAVLRLPEADDKPFSLPTFPSLQRFATVDAFKVDELRIDGAVFGEEGVFQLDAHFRPTRRAHDWELGVDAVGIGGTAGKVALLLGVRENAPLLSLFLEDEKLLPGLLGVAAPVVLELDGNLQGGVWQGVFSGVAGGQKFVDTSLELALIPQPTMQASGQVQFAVFEQLRSHTGLIGETLGFTIGAHLDGNLLVVEHFTPTFSDGAFYAAGVELGTEAHLELGGEAFTVTVNYAVEDAAPLGDLLNQTMAGRVEGRLAVDNRDETLEGMLTLKSGSLAHSTATLSDADFTIRFSSHNGLLWPPFPLAWRIYGGGQAVFAGMEQAQTLALRSSGSMESFKGLRLEQLSLEDGNVQIEAGGEVDFETLTGDLSAKVVIGDMGSLGEIFGIAVSGSLETELSIQTDEGGDGLKIVAKGDFLNFENMYLSVIGGNGGFNFDGKITDQELEIVQFVLEMGEISSMSKGIFLINNKQFTAKTDIKIQSLSSFGAFIGREIEGQLDGQVSMAGTLDAFGMEAALRVSELTLPPVEGARATITLQAEGLPSLPEGTFEVSLLDTQYGADAQGGFRLAEDSLQFSDVRLLAGENRVNAEFKLKRRHGGLSGSLEGDLPDLAHLGVLLGTTLGGSMGIKGEIEWQPETFHTSGSLQAVGLRTPWLAGERVNGEWDLQGDVLRPEGQLRLVGKDVTVSAGKLSEVLLTLEGKGGGIVFTSSGNGQFQEVYPIAFSASGQGSPDQRELLLDSLMVRLDTLEGHLQGQTRMFFPENGAWELGPFAFAIDDGVLTGQGRMEAGSIEAEVALEDLPLAMLQSFGLPELGGTLGATARFSGAMQTPVIVSDIHLRGVESPQSRQQDLPKMDFAAQLSYSNGELALEAQGSSVDFVALDATASFPLLLGFSPYTLRYPEGELTGKIQGTLQLDYVSQLISSEAQLLEGELRLDGRLGGEWENILLDAELRVERGRYENATTGTILDPFELNGEMDGKRLRLLRFEGADPHGGNIEASGELLFDTEGHFPFSITAQMHNSQLLYRDDYKARVSGGVVVHGNIKSCLVEGDLTVGPVHATPVMVSEGMRYHPVEYREINGAFQKEDNDPRRLPIEVRLDLRCEMPGQVYVRTPILETEWRGNVHVRGTLNEPSVSGSMQALRGQLDFLGKRFDLQDSIVSMNPQNLYAPFLNITAMTETGEVQAGVRIQGPADAFEISFVSTPALPEDEVLSRILFGRSAAEITPLQAIELARQAAMLGGQYSGMGVLTQRGRVPGLDAFTVRTGENLEDTQLGFGTYITQKLYVELLQGALGTDASVEYQISPSIRIRGATSSDEKSRVGLFWKRNY